MLITIQLTATRNRSQEASGQDIILVITITMMTTVKAMVRFSANLLFNGVFSVLTGKDDLTAVLQVCHFIHIQNIHIQNPVLYLSSIRK